MVNVVSKTQRVVLHTMNLCVVSSFRDSFVCKIEKLSEIFSPIECPRRLYCFYFHSELQIVFLLPKKFILLLNAIKYQFFAGEKPVRLKTGSTMNNCSKFRLTANVINKIERF